MSFHTDLVRTSCPYCGEVIDVVVDTGADEQEYVEDCSVCCQPIVMVANVFPSGAELRVRREDE